MKHDFKEADGNSVDIKPCCHMGLVIFFHHIVKIKIERRRKEGRKKIIPNKIDLILNLKPEISTAGRQMFC